MLTALLNGQPINGDVPAIHTTDRGWQYGDGLFETMLLQDGQLRFWPDHVQRLQAGCERLRIAAPDASLLRHELELLIGRETHGVVKFILSRGLSQRGYRPDAASKPTRLWQLFPPLGTRNTEIELRICNTRLSRNSLLAGLKHLNRLEQVLAQMELDDSGGAEGLLLDTEGELIGAIAGNIFLVLDGVLVTPDLRYSGVRGVMRKNVLRLAATLNFAIEERAVWPQELLLAQEVFITNALRGIQSVFGLYEGSAITTHWSGGAMIPALQQAIDAAHPFSTSLHQ